MAKRYTQEMHAYILNQSQTPHAMTVEGTANTHGPGCAGAGCGAGAGAAGTGTGAGAGTGARAAGAGAGGRGGGATTGAGAGSADFIHDGFHSAAVGFSDSLLMGLVGSDMSGERRRASGKCGMTCTSSAAPQVLFWAKWTHYP